MRSKAVDLTTLVPETRCRVDIFTEKDMKEGNEVIN